MSQTPALTPEEWRWVLRKGTKYPYLYDDSYPDTPEEAHAIAAGCLHGQPFGFTRDDVDTLLDIIAPDISTPLDGRGDVARLASLADRIAALLPPGDR